MSGILYENSIKGNEDANEDGYGHVNNYAWVIDGATDVFKRKALGVPHEVSWYIDQLVNKLYKQCQSYCDNIPLDVVLKSAVDSVYNDIYTPELESIRECELPTFALALVRISESRADYLIMGDCCVSFVKNGNPEILTDQRLTKFSKINRKKLSNYIAINGSAPANMEIFCETRSRANTPDGYPIGSIRGTGIPNAVKGSFKITPGERILMFSDGLLDYIRSDGNRLINFFNEVYINNELDRMYHFLRDEEQYLKSPRPKKVDDCTILLMEV